MSTLPTIIRTGHGLVEHIDLATDEGYEHFATVVIQDHDTADAIIADIIEHGKVAWNTDNCEFYETFTILDPTTHDTTPKTGTNTDDVLRTLSAWLASQPERLATGDLHDDLGGETADAYADGYQAALTNVCKIIATTIGNTPETAMEATWHDTIDNVVKLLYTEPD